MSLHKRNYEKEWKNQGLPEQDHGLSVSQVLGYKYSGALRQMFKWELIPVTDMKQNYKLRDIKYSVIIAKVLKKFS